MTVTGVISVVRPVAGLVIVVGSCAGMAVLDDPLDRLHLTTPAAMLGSTGICASVAVRDGVRPRAWPRSQQCWRPRRRKRLLREAARLLQ